MTNPDSVSRPGGAIFPRRFYKAAEVAPGPGGFALTLDGKPARTPSRDAVVLPTPDLAQAVADEWAAVGSVVDPRDMPLTRLANSVIDGVSRTQATVRDEILRYAGSDLLVYRAPEPADLVALQAAAWDPVLAWARDDLDATLNVGAGVMFVDQPPDLGATLGAALDRVTGTDAAAPFRLGALHVITTLTGSTLLALAVAHGRLSGADAWTAAHVDEDFQSARWGVDAEAAQRRANRWRDMQAAVRMLLLLRSEQSNAAR